MKYAGDRDQLVPGPYGIDGNRQHVRVAGGDDCHLPIHSWHKQTLMIVDRDEHGEKRHTLIDDGGRLDLLHHAVEASRWYRIDTNGRRLARLHVRHIGLVDVHTHPHP